jgi:V8-like Glu-specific endopeptidase
MKTPLYIFPLAFALCLAFFGTTTGFGQTEPLQFYIQTYQLESGYFNGSGDYNDDMTEIFIGTVELHNVPWIQLHFSDANLGQESYIIITSLYDGYWQKLSSVSMSQWNNHSAYFNGSGVEIRLFLAPLDQQVFVNIDEVIVGEWYEPDPFYSICGPTDDRIPSNQPATSRLLTVGCTAWIIPNGKIASAGHCLAGSTTIIEFNVPPSLPNGTIQHPGPEDQYSVNVSTKVFTNGGVGNDWGVFEVYPNSITNLMPKEAQSAYWTLVQDLGPDSIRITGYGVDDGTANQTQQTHVGPNWGSSGTTMRYRTDTMGGNSGSPVIDALNNVCVGVHTHGGCTSSGGNNSGTSLFHAAFWAAVDQGIIPVELSLFSATVADGNVELRWITATETNNSGFEILKASSVNAPSQDWQKVSFVEGFGTSTEPQAYTFTDRNVATGIYFYKLKQVDFDGSFYYSKVIEVSVPAPNAFILEQNYPNPFNPVTTIKFSIPVETDVKLNVYNSLGQEVSLILNSRLKEGYHEVQFDATSLTSGIYFYRLDADKFVEVKKMIILK